MIHFSCDRCKRVLGGDELRYVVRIEVQAQVDSTDGEELDDDRDHLLELHEILERLDDEDAEYDGEDVYQRRRFDLCPECQCKFMKDPMGHESLAHLGFSQN